MKRTAINILFATMFTAVGCSLAGCKERQADAATEAPPPAKVLQDINVASWTIEDTSKYPVVVAEAREATAKLMVTGTVVAAIAPTVPVVPFSSG